MDEVAEQTLHAVAKELAVTLGEARGALEAYAEHLDETALLVKCADCLHEAYGVLRVVEIYGAALLAEEMEQVSRYLIAAGPESRSQPDSLDALMRAMVQLPAYLERVLGGGRDLAIVLLPLLNDLRAVRGGPLLSEGALLLLNLSSDKQPVAPPGPADGTTELTLVQWARRLRTRYQTGLLGWIRGSRPDQHLEILASVAERIEESASIQSVYQLWWVVGAVLEALREGGLEATATVKRLVGHTDRELKRLYEVGEARYAETPPLELLNNLLYYVARATSDGPRVTAVRTSFKLQELLPVSEQIEHERESLSAPSVKLMETVAAAIKDDLSHVKDVLDIFVRKGGTETGELAAQLEMLRKISDTIGVLGLGGLRATVQAQVQRLQDVVERRVAANDGALVDIAAALITVEDSLDSQLVQLIMPQAAGETSAADTDVEFQQVQSAVLRECNVNLARVKEAIASAVAHHEPSGIDQVGALLHGITAGLLMLGKARAVDVIEAIGRHVNELLAPGHDAPRELLDRLADAIVAVEYYMETLQIGRKDPWYMLDNAETCLAAFKSAAGAEEPPVEGVPGHTLTQVIDKELAAAALAEASPAAAPAAPPPAPRDGAIDLTATGAGDPDLIALFIEEAREEVAKVDELFPRWDENPLDQDSLTRLRRSFHTLKGSGRMVGARLVGDCAWSVENLLNRVINGTLSRTPGMLSALRDVIAMLPALVDELETGAPPPAGILPLMGLINDLAEGREPEPAGAPAATESPPEAVEAAPAPAPTVVAETIPADVAAPAATVPAIAAGSEARERLESLLTEPSAPLVPPAAAPEPELLPEVAITAPATGDDPVLIDIYRGEVASHLAALREYLDGCTGHFAPFPVTEALHRACHTLSGASKMAEAHQGIKLAEPLNAYIRKLYDHHLGLPEAGRRLLADIVEALGNVADNFAESTGFFVTHPDLLARLQWLDGDATREIGARAPEADFASTTAEVRVPEAADLLSLEEMILPAEPPPAPAATPEVAPPAAAAAPAGDEFDAEIAVIFSEEATELLEVAERTFATFRADAGGQATLSELKRVLHTLKGGARMAGVRAMGDLAHEVESLLTLREAGGNAADRASIEVLQASLDELNRMRDVVSAGRPVAPAPGLIARIQALGRGTAAVAEPVVAPTEPPAVMPPPIVAPIATTASASAEPPVVEPVAVEPTAAEPVAVAAKAAFTQLIGEVAHEEPPAAPAVVPEPAAEVPEASAVETPPLAPPTVEVPEIEAVPVPATAPAEPVVPETPVAAESVAVEPEAAPVASMVVDMPPPPSADAVTFAPVSAPAAEELPPTAAAAEQASEAPAMTEPEEPRIPALPPGREVVPMPERQELARVDAELLDNLLNAAGEVSIYRARLEQQFSSVEFNLAELARVVQRLKDQLRKLELETETQILHRHQDDGTRRSDFDPLELDRYSALQQYSRALAESTSDVASVQGLLESQVRDAQNLLLQQARIVTDLQNGLMRTRMVPFQRYVARLTRIVRQVAGETGRKAELDVTGAAGELDRQVLERMMPPFEHMLRNAVVHGIESPANRVAAGKPEVGRVEVSLRREGAEVVIIVTDDGAGMNLRAIRDKAVALGLLQPKQQLSDHDTLQLVLEPGFSTAPSITQSAGRGVGMDVVANEVKRLGGSLHIDTAAGQGTRFTIRLPFTLAVSQALIVRTADELYALPLPTVESVVRLPRADVQRYLASDQPLYEYGGQRYRFQNLGLYVGMPPAQLPENEAPVPVVLIRAGDSSTALVADELVGSREIVVKSVGPQISGIRGIAGATILGDGRIVIILDMHSLVRGDWRSRPVVESAERVDRRTFALVVDDSITVRRVTQRLLERNGMRVLTAKDGVDALAILQEHVPDIILLDIEMPRMDGYEVAAHVRADPRLEHVPIVMITSRVGEKHRARAIELGVDDYLGKPYQESQLLDAIEPLVNRRREPT